MSAPRRIFTNNAHVAAMLDGVAELPCAFCSAPCPVPDFVLAVIQREGEHHPLAVCAACTDTLIVVLPLFREGLAHAEHPPT